MNWFLSQDCGEVEGERFIENFTPIREDRVIWSQSRHVEADLTACFQILDVPVVGKWEQIEGKKLENELQIVEAFMGFCDEWFCVMQISNTPYLTVIIFWVRTSLTLCPIY